ncbi:hypothetical protein FQR65_LT09327 [Abscondita terminalis]|nr:hypothetical protein FQR65_LT09327 [Abscondita terminalis]
MKFKLQTYKFVSQEYRYFPVFYEDNPCIALKLDPFGSSMRNFNTNILACPFEIGHYYLHEAKLNQSRLPPYAPRGQFMFDVETYDDKILLTKAHIFNDYYIKYERHLFKFYNKEYLKNVNVSYHFYNRTVRLLSWSLDLIKRIGTNMKFKFQTYKFASQEYRYFPVFYEDNPCIALKLDQFGSSMRNFNTNVLACPFEIGHYYLHEANLNQSRLPPHAPRGQFMFDCETYDNNILLAKVQIFVKVIPTNPLEIVRN